MSSSSSSMRRGDLFDFTKLRDARNVSRGKVNIIGVVLEHGFPRQTKGTDWYYFLRIIDDTHHDPGLPVQVFFESLDKSPCVLSPGDIIQFQSVTIKTIVGKLSAVFNKKYSSFAVYDGKEGCSPYQASDGFREKDRDKIYVTDMRRWFKGFQLDQSSDNFFPVRKLVEGEHFDLFCKVLYVHDEAGGQWTVFAWDGSDAPPCSIHKKLVDEMHHPLALHLEPFLLAREIVCTFPTVGSILRVVSQDIEINHLPRLSAGKWIKFANLVCEVHEGLWRVVLTSYSRICYAANDDQVKPKPQRLYEARISATPKIKRRMPQWTLPLPSQVTEIDIVDDEESSTLMDVLTSTEVMAKFKCVVRVLSILPCNAADYLFPDGINRIRVTLEDPTMRIHAYLYAEEAVTFFDGSPSVEELSKKRNQLLGASADVDGKEIDDTPRDPPWVRVSLIAENQIEGALESRQYRIRGTRLVGS